MNHSEQIGELAVALIACQGSLTGARKESNNTFFKSSYADLESVWEAARTPLTKNGLCIVQYGRDGKLVTRLLHKSGQWIEGEMTLNPTKNDPQALGSAVTYLRRYGLAAMLGIVQTDDDGNDASRPGSGSYTPTAGDLKGRRINTVPIEELEEYRLKIENNFNGKAMPPNVKDIYIAVTTYLKEQ